MSFARITAYGAQIACAAALTPEDTTRGGEKPVSSICNDIRFVSVENADHRFVDPLKMDVVIKHITELFGM